MATDINTWEQVKLAGGGPFVTYSPTSPIAGSPRAHVIELRSDGKERPTDPGGPWYNHDRKTFLGKMAESVPLAKAWAEKRYGVREWKRNAMGDYVPAGVAEKVPMRRVK